MEAFSAWIASVVAQLGYVEIVFLMALESSLFPLPSEIVMIPAGYLAARGELDPTWVVLAGTLGSMIGASINYLIGRFLGRAFLLRYGRYLLIDEGKYHEAEALFLRNAAVATFVGRLLPVIRHLISLPAGVFGMPLLTFFMLTAAGSALWCSILVLAGYYLGEPAVALFSQYVHELTLLVLVVLILPLLWFVLRKRAR